MDIDDRPAYSWALPAIHGFKLTRYELRIIAQHRFDEVCEIEMHMAVADSLNSRDDNVHMVAVRKEETIRQALGDKEFMEATAEVKKIWDKRFADLKGSIRSASALMP